MSLDLAIAELPPWLDILELGPYLTMAEVRPYDRIEIKPLEGKLAQFWHGEEKRVGVAVQARRTPYDFTIEEPTFALKTALGGDVAEFQFAQDKIKVEGHEIHYLLDTAPLKPATQPYQGVFSFKVAGETFYGVVAIRIHRIVGAA